MPYYNKTMESYGSRLQYEEDIERRAGLPPGFRVATRRLEFHPAELPGEKLFPMDLTLIELTRPSSAAAGLFTRNAFPGAPVLLCRERITSGTVRGILVNNKVANVCAPGGLADARRVTEALARLTGGSADEWLYASTGVIGWKIPADAIIENLPPLREAAQSESLLPAARSIMTTDRYPKLHSASVGNARIVGIAKGAGMIEPDLATMLSFILTDADLPRELLQRALAEVVDDSFNAISVDGDQSTSDMSLLLSSRQSDKVDFREFVAALREVTAKLARDIVRNGEGTAHVIEVRVSGADNDKQAKRLAKGIINSPLVKTAIYGNDPNLGRLVAALGAAAGAMEISLDPGKLVIRIDTRVVFENGEFRLDPETETELAAYLKKNSFDPEQKGYPEHDGQVVIGIDLQGGDEQYDGGRFCAWEATFRTSIFAKTPNTAAEYHKKYNKDRRWRASRNG